MPYSFFLSPKFHKKQLNKGNRYKSCNELKNFPFLKLLSSGFHHYPHPACHTHCWTWASPFSPT